MNRRDVDHLRELTSQPGSGVANPVARQMGHYGLANYKSETAAPQSRAGDPRSFPRLARATVQRSSNRDGPRVVAKPILGGLHDE